MWARQSKVSGGLFQTIELLFHFRKKNSIIVSQQNNKPTHLTDNQILKRFSQQKGSFLGNCIFYVIYNPFNSILD